MARSDLIAADGVVVQVQKHFRLIVDHHPVRSIKGSFAIFLLMARRAFVLLLVSTGRYIDGVNPDVMAGGE